MLVVGMRQIIFSFLFSISATAATPQKFCFSSIAPISPNAPSTQDQVAAADALYEREFKTQRSEGYPRPYLVIGDFRSGTEVVVQQVYKRMKTAWQRGGQTLPVRVNLDDPNLIPAARSGHLTVRDVDRLLVSSLWNSIADCGRMNFFVAPVGAEAFEGHTLWEILRSSRYRDYSNRQARPPVATFLFEGAPELLEALSGHPETMRLVAKYLSDVASDNTTSLLSSERLEIRILADSIYYGSGGSGAYGMIGYYFISSPQMPGMLAATTVEQNQQTLLANAFSSSSFFRDASQEPPWWQWMGFPIKKEP